MHILIAVILPVFVVIGFGYLGKKSGLFRDEQADAVMTFVQKFALPGLLFSAISRLDLAQSFDFRILGSFYSGALVGFFVCLFGARFLFDRPWTDSVAIGFAGMFTNSLLLGLPLSERAFGAASLSTNYAIVAVHSPFCYLVGITAMEIVLGGNLRDWRTVPRILKAMFSNGLVVGLACGFVVNLLHIPLPQFFYDAIDLLARAAVPAALFGLGAILARYRPEGDLLAALMIVGCSLILHPLVTLTLGHATGLTKPVMQNMVLTAAMAPGVNAFLFANSYGVAKRVAATSVLLGTGLSIFTAWGWLHLL